MKWFRMYDDLVDNPKVQKLTARLFKFWVNCLCLANKGKVRGMIGTTEYVSFRLRIRLDDAERHLGNLKERFLLDRDSNGVWFPHDWCEFQREFDNSAAIKRQQREKHSAQTKDLGKNVHGQKKDKNSPDTDTDTDTDNPPNPLRGNNQPKRSRMVPKDFTVTEQMRDWAKEEVPDADIDAETRIFRDHEFEKPKSDWLATWKNWIRNSRRYRETRKQARESVAEHNRKVLEAMNER